MNTTNRNDNNTYNNKRIFHCPHIETYTHTINHGILTSSKELSIYKSCLLVLSSVKTTISSTHETHYGVNLGKLQVSLQTHTYLRVQPFERLGLLS